MRQQLNRSYLPKLLDARQLEDVSLTDLIILVRSEKILSQYLPTGRLRIDPRNGERIIYHAARGQRPHDNLPIPKTSPMVTEKCVVCQGNITRIIDLAELSQGFTFINKNLYPVLYPFEQTMTQAIESYGLHFLQWTSSIHDRDWHNMPLKDATIVMARLAAMEKKLLAESGEIFGSNHGRSERKPNRASVLIIKNFGRLVGGSLTHGHQQIVLSNVISRRQEENLNFLREQGEPFSHHMLHTNSSELLVKDYGPAQLIVPYFMRRPYDMILLTKNTSRAHIHQLNEAELQAVAKGWCDAIRAMRRIMPEMNRPIAYNVVTHNGPGAGLYFEFLPYTQELGGFEQLGLYVCQSTPAEAAARLRSIVIGPES